jgi:hypothetical protein
MKLLQNVYQLTTFSNGKSFPTQFLRDALPDVETALFFAKVYKLTPEDVSTLLPAVCPGPVVAALLTQAENHSTTLQDYLVETYVDEDGDWYFQAEAVEGVPGAQQPVQTEILPELWKNVEVEIAKSIADVATKISDTIAHMPGRTGEMVFKTLAQVNARRPVVGDYRAQIQHQQIKQVLVVFDVSGSMSEHTVKTIVDDVVGLAYESNASLAVVSNTCTFWEPGGYDTSVVLAAAEYGGTHYEQLAPLFDGRTWDVVITIADYDSSPAAMHVLQACNAKIGQLFDISLVPKSTYLAECLAHMAGEVRPLLIASRSLCYD